jgi:hypothetical protein
MFGTGTNGVLVAEAQLVQGLIRVLGAEISDLLYFHRKRQKVGRNRRLDNKAKLSPCILCASRRRRDMPYRDLVNQAKHTAQALGCSALMPNADGGNTTDGKGCLTYTPVGPGTLRSISSLSLQTQDHLLRKFPTEK